LTKTNASIGVVSQSVETTAGPSRSGSSLITSTKTLLRPGVPPFDGGLPPLVTQNRNRACVEPKVHAQTHVEPEPPHRERPQRVAVAKTDRPIDSGSADPSNHLIQPAGDLLSRFPTRNLASPDRPARNRLPDLLAGLALILAVEPLSEVAIDLRFARAYKTSQLGSLAGPSPRTAQDQLEILGRQVPVEGAGLPLAVLGER
jgi:hypothetical protein